PPRAGYGPPAPAGPARGLAGRRAPRGRSSPVLHSRFRDAPLPASAITPGLQLLLADRAEDLLGLGLGQSSALPGTPLRSTAPLPPTTRRTPTASAPRGRHAPVAATTVAAIPRFLRGATRPRRVLRPGGRHGAAPQRQRDQGGRAA